MTLFVLNATSIFTMLYKHIFTARDVIKKLLSKTTFFMERIPTAFFVGVVLLLTLAYIVIFFNMPLSEDASFYAFLSKEMSLGSVLHVDMPVATNSLVLYFIALLFKLFGSGVAVFTGVYAASYIFLTLTVFFLVNKFLGKFHAFIAGILTSIFAVIPQLVIDLERNPIYFCIALVLLGTFFYLSDSKHKMLYYGLCLGLASLIRETFVIIPLFYIALEFLLFLEALIMHRRSTSKVIIQRNVLFFLGLAGAFFINVILLTVFHSWRAYLLDMLHSGVSFRFSHGFFSLGRIRDNLSALSWGYQNLYGIFIWLLFSIYLIKTENLLVQQIKKFLLPAFLIEMLVMNSTREYDIIPVLVLSAITLTFVLQALLENIRNRPVGEIIFLVVTALVLLPNVPNYYANLKGGFSSFGLIALHAHNPKYNQDFHNVRLLNVVSAIPFKTLSTMSEWGVLFLSSDHEKESYPYYYDLFASQNLNRPQIWVDQIKGINEQKVDLVISRKPGFYARDDLDQAMAHYILIADFDFPTVFDGMAAYRNRIFMSKNFFAAHYHVGQAQKFPLPPHTIISVQNRSDQGVIMKVDVSPQTCMSTVALNTGFSKIQNNSGDPNISTSGVFSFVAPHGSLTLAETPACAVNTAIVTVTTYQLA